MRFQRLLSARECVVFVFGALLAVVSSAALLYPDAARADVEIGNVNGGGTLQWEMDTVQTPAANPRAHFPAVPYQAELRNTSDAGAAHADVRPLEEGRAVEAPAAGSGLLNAAVPVYSTTAWNNLGYITLDALAPDAYTIINADQPRNVYAATFIDGDLSTHYGIAASGGALPINSFIAIDTATGDFEILGVVTGGPASDFFNSIKWDYTTSTLYGISSDALYTIDPDTYQAELIGSFDLSGALMLAIAISPEGLMYGLDISSDALYAIDKTTGEAVAIGPLGFNANFAQDMDFDRSDGTLYWGGYFGGGNSQVMTIDTTTGAATPIGPVSGGTELLSFSIARPHQEPAELLIDPLSLDFGSQGTTSAAVLAITISNVALAGAADLPVTQIALISGAPDYQISGNDCPASLTPGQSCTVEVRFAPSEPGPRQGMLRIEANGETSNLNLLGVGTEPEPIIFEDRFEN